MNKEIEEREVKSKKAAVPHPGWAATIAFQLAGIVLVLSGIVTVLNTVDGARPSLCKWGVFRSVMCDDSSVQTKEAQENSAKDDMDFTLFNKECGEFTANVALDLPEVRSYFFCGSDNCIVTQTVDYGEGLENANVYAQAFRMSDVKISEFELSNGAVEPRALSVECLTGRCTRGLIGKNYNEVGSRASLFFASAKCAKNFTTFLKSNIHSAD